MREGVCTRRCVRVESVCMKVGMCVKECGKIGSVGKNAGMWALVVEGWGYVVGDGLFRCVLVTARCGFRRKGWHEVLHWCVERGMVIVGMV